MSMTKSKKRAGMMESLRPAVREFYQPARIVNSTGKQRRFRYGHRALINTGCGKLDKTEVQSERMTEVPIVMKSAKLGELQGLSFTSVHVTLFSNLVANWQVVRVPEWKRFGQTDVEIRTSGDNDFERIAAELYGSHFSSGSTSQSVSDFTERAAPAR